MLFPNKIVPYSESVLFFFPLVLEEVKAREDGISPITLYEELKNSLDVSCFIDVLDSLFALGKITLDERKGVLFYVV